ncbi:MAG: hypothetical protein LUG18_15840 [Candidatus Azobacteroides sp.]|nr:hypothetical protein [Candidatus Azobacteroides sp.]
MTLYNPYIGYFDLIIIVIIILLNILYRKYKPEYLEAWCGCLGQIVIFLFYLLVLPFLSITVEIDIVCKEGNCMDSFTLLYTLLRFPLYWGLGIIQIVVSKYIL